MGDDIITCVSVKGFRATYLAICTPLVSGVILVLNGSALDRDRYPLVAGSVGLSTESECHCYTYCSPGNVSRMYWAKKNVPRSILMAKLSTIPNQAFPCKLPVSTNKSLDPSRVIGPLIAHRGSGVVQFFTLCYQLPWISLLLMMLCFTFLSRTPMFGCSLSGE